MKAQVRRRVPPVGGGKRVLHAARAVGRVRSGQQEIRIIDHIGLPRLDCVVKGLGAVAAEVKRDGAREPIEFEDQIRQVCASSQLGGDRPGEPRLLDQHVLVRC